MPQNFTWSKPTAGWCPSDSDINGRETALLRMSNVELDHNGAVSLIGGTEVTKAGLTAAAHTLYSRIINNSRKDYAALADGSVLRGDDTIVSIAQGHSTQAAFGTAFNYTLVCSGNKRLKDSGTGTPVNLGIIPANLPITLQGVNSYSTELLIPSSYVSVIHVENTAPPVDNTIVSGYLADFNAGESWADYNGGTLDYTVGPIDGTSAVRLDTKDYSQSVSATFGTPHDTTIGSSVPDDDILTMWYKFHWDPILSAGVNGLAVYFTDADSNVIVWGIVNHATDGWQQDVWIPFSVARKLGNSTDNPNIGTDGSAFYLSGSSTFDWTRLAKIETHAVYDITLTGLQITLGGWNFVGVKNADIVPPATDVVVTALPTPTISGTKLISLQGSTPSGGTVDWSKLVNSYDATDIDVGTDNDYFTLNIQIGDGEDITNIDYIDIDILLNPITDPGYQSTIYATYRWYNTETNGYTLRIKALRKDFTPIGTPLADWSKIYGIQVTAALWGQITITLLGSSIFNLTPQTEVYFGMYGGGKALQGTYQYAQINVNNNGAYLAKSVLGVVSDPIILDKGNPRLQFQNPQAIDPQVNEVWIFRRGGIPDPLAYYPSTTLDQWYRVAVIQAKDFGTLFIDTISDQEAIRLNITVNLNLVSIAYTSIAEAVLSIIGPIFGRWYYFTENFMYPSDVNDPDLVDASQAIRTCGSKSEVFMWAVTVNESVVLVGTSIDIYILTGTFITLPDNTVDIFYRPLGSQFPPITNDAVSYGSLVYYLSNDGWRSCDQNGTNPLLVAPNTDRLYRGETCYSYTPPDLHISPGSARFPITIARNKLWCFIKDTARCEVYDFIRQYWRVIEYDLGEVTACFATQDGEVLTAYSLSSSYTLREIDKQDSKLIDGTTQQIVSILTPIFGSDTPRNRKDNYTLKVRCYTGVTSALIVAIVDELGTEYASSAITSATRVTDTVIDLHALKAICKTWQLKITGAVDDLILEDISIDYDLRPTQLTFLRLYNSNFGSASRKRLRVWPQIIDTMGQNVTFTPYVDNTALGAVTINTAEKLTKLVQIKTDAFGIDYGATIDGGGNLFEHWESGQPDIVQVLPIARQFDQIGPEDLFRYGRVKQFEYRVLSEGTSIPYIIYFNDSSSLVGSITTVSSVEATYYIDVPKGTAGNIVRVVFGPTNFDFHRFYTRVQVFRTGKDSELEWITIPGTN